VRVGGDDGELRPCHSTYVYSIESRLITRAVPELGSIPQKFIQYVPSIRLQGGFLANLIRGCARQLAELVDLILVAIGETS